MQHLPDWFEPEWLAFPILALQNGAALLGGWILIRRAGRPARDGEPCGFARAAFPWAAVACALGCYAFLWTALSRSFFLLARLAANDLFIVTPPLLIAQGRAWARAGGAAGRSGAALVWLAAAGLLAIYAEAFHLEPYRLEATHHDVRAPGLPRPLRIAVAADLQADRIGPFEERALHETVAGRPDLILLPGDYLQIYGPRRMTEETGRLQRVLRDLPMDAPLGAFAVDGDCEGFHWAGLFEGTAVRPLANATADIPQANLFLAGLDLEASRDLGGRVLASLLRRAPEGRFVVVVGHAPEFALSPPAARAGLCVAGHTHGGQVQLPWLGPLVTFSAVPRAIAAGGLHDLGGRAVYISRGIGLERGMAPRLRFRCRPEVGLLTLASHP